MQAMIFAAGKGTRLRPLTDNVPKALVAVGGQPLLRRLIEKMKGAGAERIVVNVHHLAPMIKAYLKANANFGLDIRVSDETEELLDTGGGLRKAAALLMPGEPVLLHNVDILSNIDLRRLYDTAAADRADALLVVSSRPTTRYLLFDGDMRLAGWTNVTTGEVRSPYPGIDPKLCRRYAFAGIHVVKPQVTALMSTFPQMFGIMDFYIQTCRTACIKGVAVPNLRILDVGKQSSLAAAGAFLRSLEYDEQMMPHARNSSAEEDHNDRQ